MALDFRKKKNIFDDIGNFLGGVGRGAGKALDFITPGDQRAMYMSRPQIQQQDQAKARQAQDKIQGKIQQAQTVKQSPIFQREQPRVRSMLDQGRSFEDISGNTGLGVEEVRNYVDVFRPGYGIKKSQLGRAGQLVGDTVSNVVGGIAEGVTSIPRVVGTTLGAGLKPDTQNALNALDAAYKRGEISQARLADEVQRLTGDIVGRGAKVDESGIQYGAKGADDFLKQAVGAGYNTAANVVPFAKGASVTLKGGNILARNGSKVGLTDQGKKLTKEAGAWTVADTANAALNGQLTPEGIALSAAMNLGLPVAGAATGKVVRGSAKGIDKAADKAYGAMDKAGEAADTARAELTDHIRRIQQNDERLARQGMSPNHPTRVNNRKAIAQATQQIRETGSVQLPGRGQNKSRQPVEGDEAYRQRQKEAQSRYDQKPVAAARDATGQEVYDPRLVAQRMDNREYTRQKKAKVTLKGQKELNPEQSLAYQQGIIQDPGSAAEAYNRRKYTVDGESKSINDLIKEYGPEEGRKARDFEQYRLYKDELERVGYGEQNTLGVADDVMDAYVRQYEAVNPNAPRHNAILRQASFDVLQRRNQAGIDNPELLERAGRYKNYNPRKPVEPEGYQRTQVKGGVRSSIKGTKARDEGTGGPVRSPLGYFRDINTQTVKSEASQRRGLEMRRRIKEGNAQGAREVVDAEKVIEHKKSLGRLRELGQKVKDVAALKKSAQKDVKKARQADTTRKQAASEVRGFLRNAREDGQFGDIAPVQRMTDQEYRAQKSLAETDYARSLDTLKRDGITPEQRRKQRVEINRLHRERLADLEAQREGQRDTSAVDQMSDQDALELLDTITGSGEKGLARIANKLAKSTGMTAQQAREFLRGVQSELKDTRLDRSEEYRTFVSTTQNTERGTQTITYRIDGEEGKIEIPADYAAELAKQDYTVSVTERAAGAFSNAQKITWTGALSPVFKIINVTVKNPLLAYRNADGLSGISPRAIKAGIGSLFGTKKMRSFKNEMLQRGGAYENAMQTRNINSTTADDIAARANLKTFFARNPVKTVQDLWKGLNQGLAHMDNAQRTGLAYSAYQRAKRLGYPDDQAKDVAAQAMAKTFGDFNRISRLARNLEAIIPYSGSIQAGTRAIVRASKTKPIQTAVKDASLVAAMGGFTLYSLQNNAEYYQDRLDEGKEYELDNYWTIVLPGAEKDDKGNWEGVIRIPLTPDLRPMNRATWKSAYDLANQEGLDIGLVAGEMFNQFTGDMANSVYDRSKTNDGENPLGGILAGGPIATGIKIGSGVDPRTGKPLADEFTAGKPRTEQVRDNTSDFAKSASTITGGALTPIQVDTFADQMGAFGDVLQNKGGKGAGALVDIGKQFQPSASATDKQKKGRAYFKDKEDILSTFENRDDYEGFKLITEKNSEKTIDDSATRAKLMLSQPNVLKGLQELDKRKRDRGEMGDPFFDLSHEQQQKVLRYRGAKDLNAAKQAYDKDGNPLFVSLGLDDKWYDDYRSKEDEYFASFSDGGGEYLTYSGAQKPQASPELQNKLDYYYTLKKGTGERSAFLRANPDVLDHWAASNQFTNAERVALGLEVNTEDDGSGGSGGSGRGFANRPYNPGSKYRYAVSLSPEKYSVKPKVSVKGKSTAPTKGKGSVAKPKVTVRKAKV